MAIFEAEYSKSPDNMSKECGKALKQIEDRMYAKDFKDEYENVLCYGISFFKKDVLLYRKKGLSGNNRLVCCGAELLCFLKKRSDEVVHTVI